jgi:hypothetical protein
MTRKGLTVLLKGHESSTLATLYERLKPKES